MSPRFAGRGMCALRFHGRARRARHLRERGNSVCRRTGGCCSRRKASCRRSLPMHATYLHESCSGQDAATALLRFSHTCNLPAIAAATQATSNFPTSLNDMPWRSDTPGTDVALCEQHPRSAWPRGAPLQLAALASQSKLDFARQSTAEPDQHSASASGSSHSVRCPAIEDCTP